MATLQQVVDYIQQYKDKYPTNALRNALLKQNVPEATIDEAIRIVMRTQAPASPLTSQSGTVPRQTAPGSRQTPTAQPSMSTQHESPAPVSAQAPAHLARSSLLNELIKASREDNIEKVEKLINDGAEVNTRDNHGYTALMMASASGHIKIVEKLIQHGAEVNAKDNNGATALIIAAAVGQTKTVEKLIEQKAEVNVENKDNVTALYMAAFNGHTETVKKLIEHRADVNARDNNGGTALMLAVSNGHMETVEMLIDHGADVNARDNNGDTPLMGAAFNGHTETVKKLIEHRADVNAKNNKDITVLMYATGKTKVVKLLQSAGVTTKTEEPLNLDSEDYIYGGVPFLGHILALINYILGKKKRALFFLIASTIGTVVCIMIYLFTVVW